MRSRMSLIIWLAALFLVIGSVTPAAAKRNSNPGEGPQPVEYPSCAALDEDPESGVKDGVIPVTSGGLVEVQCLWSPDDPEAVGNWHGKIGIELPIPDSELTSLVVFVRDSKPGDICLLEQLRQPDGLSFQFEFPLVDGSDSYWDRDEATNTDKATKWCARFDDGGGRDDLNGEPLHLSVNFRSKPDTKVEIALSVVDVEG